MELGKIAHSYLDYMLGAVLFMLPAFVSFGGNKTAQLVMATTGLFMLLYNLTTDYSLSIVKYITFHNHLVLDYIIGVYLAFSPWLFGFADQTHVIFVIFGLLQIVLSFVTEDPLTQLT